MLNRSLFWRASVLLAFCFGLLGDAKATQIFMENNTEATSFRVRVFRSDIPGDPGTLWDNVPPGVWVALDDNNVQSVEQYEFYTYDITDTLEENVLVYSMLWGSRVIEATAAGGQIVHVSLTTGMDETSVGRVVLANSSGADAYWNGNTISAGTTNAFVVPSASYSLAEWSTVTRPWGWLPSVTLLQPQTWSGGGGTLTTDQEMMLWLHDHDPEHWVTWSWNGGTGVWDFGSTGNPGEGSGAGGGGSGGGGGGSGGGGGGSGGGGATGTGNVGGQTITITLDGVALETTQLRNEQELIRIRENAETNNVLMATNNVVLGEMLALMNGAAPGNNENAAEEAEEAAEALVGGIEHEADGIKGLFQRTVNVTLISSAVDPSAFIIPVDLPDGSHREINWDPRAYPDLMTVFTVVKALMTLYLFYYAIMHLWHWYEHKVEQAQLTNPTGNSGQALLGTNANWVTSGLNATIVTAIIAVLSVGLLTLAVSYITNSAVGYYMAQTGVLDGSHSMYSSLIVSRAMVLIDVAFPINAIIGTFFAIMLVEIIGHYVWLGFGLAIRFVNA